MAVLRDIVLVFVGAGAGGACRWALGIFARAALGETRFPAATFLANFIACVIIGALAGLALRGGFFANAHVRLFLVTGFLGGMSTMSTFGLETVSLLRRGELAIAGANICLTLGACLVAVWLLFRATEP